MRMNPHSRPTAQPGTANTPPQRGSAHPRGRGRWIRGALASLAITTFAFAPALAEPMIFNVTGRGNLLVAHYQEHAGICAGDAQTIARAKHGATDFQVVGHPVGQAVPRNLATSLGHHEVTEVMDASATYLVAALYHLYRPAPSDSELQAESFAWAVQNQLSSWGWFSTRAPSDGGALARQMLAHAKDWAGPYEIRAEFKGAGAPWDLQLTGVGVQSAAGKWLPGLSGTLTLSGPATFENGSATHRFTTEERPLAMPVRAGGSGEITAQITVDGLPAAQINILESTKHQDLISVGPNASSAHGRASITVEAPHLAVDFHTQVEAKTINPDETAIDNIFVTAEHWPTDASGQPLPLQLRARLYGPFQQAPVQSPHVPQDAPLMGEQMLTVHGSGTHQVSLAPVAETAEGMEAGGQWPAGHYTWVVSALGADQMAGTGEQETRVHLERDVVSAFGIPQESFEVVPPAPPAPPETPAAPPTPPTPPVQTPTPPAPSTDVTTPPGVTIPPTSEVETTPPSQTPPLHKPQLPLTGASDLLPTTVVIALAGISLTLLARAYRPTNHDEDRQ